MFISLRRVVVHQSLSKFYHKLLEVAMIFGWPKQHAVYAIIAPSARAERKEDTER